MIHRCERYRAEKTARNSHSLLLFGFQQCVEYQTFQLILLPFVVNLKCDRSFRNLEQFQQPLHNSSCCLPLWQSSRPHLSIPVAAHFKFIKLVRNRYHSSPLFVLWLLYVASVHALVKSNANAVMPLAFPAHETLICASMTWFGCLIIISSIICRRFYNYFYITLALSVCILPMTADVNVVFLFCIVNIYYFMLLYFETCMKWRGIEIWSMLGVLEILFRWH